ncbi:MAG: hypothetical protein OEM83_07460 [Gammaproteobacteria bacterium]|nr:hypothetical protein [Gammaproteobacteria bacterium]MDH5511719.1 hypothetical protein [Gammaproteobacteria bacterium]
MLMKMLLGLCLLRTAPQDLPTSRALMAVVLVAYGAADVITVLDILTLENALVVAAVDTLLLVAATQLVLQWRRFENRATQTLTALAGSGALLSMLAWAGAGLVRGVLAPEWIWAIFLVWYTLVFGHVLRHALSVSYAAGVGASLVYLILSMSVTGLFMYPIPSTD